MNALAARILDRLADKATEGAALLRALADHLATAHRCATRTKDYR